MAYNVIHNTGENRFEVIIDGLMCMVDYQTDNEGNLIVTHTGVPTELEGNGIAAAMTKTMLEYAGENCLKVLPICPYTQSYMAKHPEYRNLLPS